MNERLIIDGNNLLHIMHEQSMGPPVARLRLAEMIADYATDRNIDAIIVFDGPPPAGGLGQQFSRLAADIRFSGPVTADDIIVQLLDQRPPSTAPTVITSDREVQTAARLHHCAFEDSASFAGQLLAWEAHVRRGASAPSPAPPAVSKPEKPDMVDADELDRVMRELGEDLDDLPPMWQI